jgi:uncharacterized protein (DUF927 family)
VYDETMTEEIKVIKLNMASHSKGETMEVEEFEKWAQSIVEVELENIKSMANNISDQKAKEEANLLGLSTIDSDIKNNPEAFKILKNYVANMIAERIAKSEKVNYERIIQEIIDHIMTFCVGYKAASIKT